MRRLIERIVLGRKYGHTWLVTGAHLYAVPIWYNGRTVQVVTVRAGSEEEAGDKALKYMRANLYPHRIKRQEEPGDSDGQR